MQNQTNNIKEGRVTGYHRFSLVKLKGEVGDKGWSPSQFADLLNRVLPPELRISKAAAYGWLKAEYKPGIDYLPYFALLFGIKNAELYSRLYTEEDVN